VAERAQISDELGNDANVPCLSASQYRASWMAQSQPASLLWIRWAGDIDTEERSQTPAADTGLRSPATSSVGRGGIAVSTCPPAPAASRWSQDKAWRETTREELYSTSVRQRLQISQISAAQVWVFMTREFRGPSRAGRRICARARHLG